MTSYELLQGIIRGVNSVSNPTTLTVSAINAVINSPYAKQTIRRLLLDPINRKLVPTLKYRGWEEMNYIFNAMYMMMPKTLKDDILEFDDSQWDDLVKAFNTDTVYFGRYLPDTEKGKARTILIKNNGCAIYISYRLDYENYSMYWNMYFIGLNADKMMKEVQKAYEAAKFDQNEGYRLRNKRRVSVYTFENGPRPRRSSCTVPSTIIIDHVKDQLDDIINATKLSEDISNRYEINKTTGVLLYGPHGTGKSTIARYLAMELDRIILMTSADNLAFVIDYVKDHTREKYIILIEDIDFKFVDRRGTKKDDKNTDMMAKTDLLFQVLDGVLAENNIMVVATTNYIDRLDPALIRDGRFDFRIEVLGLCYDEAAKVCERFDITPEEIRLSDWKTPISPASLQTTILKYKTSVNTN